MTRRDAKAMLEKNGATRPWFTALASAQRTNDP
jgi:hypothetical protein